MSVDERGEILKVLSGAIIRETSAFNFYYKGSENPLLPPGARGLLARLAEEERVHRQLLVAEYTTIEKGWSGTGSGPGEESLSYLIPGDPSFSPLEIGGEFEAAALTLPTRLVGGDNIISRVVRGHDGSARGTLLLLYDAMGHGMETTEINALAARTVGEYVESTSLSRMEADMLGPRQLVEQINARIAERYEGEGVFLTVLGVLFDARRGTLSYTCAGHEPPFIVRRDGAARSLLQTQLIAGIDPAFRYREHAVDFAPGDLFCAFSDGIIEAENREGVLFGRAGVARILEKQRADEPDAIARGLLRALSGHLGGEPVRDEISIIVVKAKGALA
ncbi:MAG: SpoIIE family protein phosphatase [Candidatus Krumholzibacteria bacterium]|nr:SpoIIE family protein phosphatase [Candidatus Krumholzibacteria bacterium]